MKDKSFNIDIHDTNDTYKQNENKSFYKLGA